MSCDCVPKAELIDKMGNILESDASTGSDVENEPEIDAKGIHK